MKSVLAFGDSLTWGSRPDGGGRHAFEDRWTSVLEAGLEGVTVIPDGLRGRTTAMDQHASPANLNGAALLPSALHAHAPLDLVIIALGANDVFFGYSLQRAVRGLEHLVEIARRHPMRMPDAVQPKVLLVLPQPLMPCGDPFVTNDLIETSERFVLLAKERAEQIDAPFFETGSVAESSVLDGIHMDATNTRALGEALIPIVGAMLNER